MRYAVLLLAMALVLFAAPAPPAQAEVVVTLGQAEAPLNGPWMFRMGDDPRWASPESDDRDWERVDLTPAPGSHDGDVGIPGYVPGWAARGHAGQWGHAWYRLLVRWSVTPGSAPVLVGPPLVDGAYEIFWNGRRVGAIGDFDVSPPRVYATRPQLFPLGETASSGEAVLAIHVYLPKRFAADPEGGGIHVAPILAEPMAGSARHLAQWWKTFWGYVVDLVEPCMLLTLALYALSLRRGDRFVPFAAASLASIAVSRLNQPLLFWTAVETVHTHAIVRYVLFNPLAIVGWVIACYRLGGRSDRRIDVAVCFFGVAAAVAAYPGIDSDRLATAARLALLACFFGSVFFVARGARMRPLALPTILVVAAALFASELSRIGIPGIWFPFGVGVSRTQYAIAIAIPLLTALFHVRHRAARV